MAAAADHAAGRAGYLARSLRATARRREGRPGFYGLTMPLRIEDYAMIGDCETAALVGRDGSIDWLCWPRFDSDACFASLVGTEEHGHWRIAPRDQKASISRRYRGNSLILETRFETAEGAVLLVDFMPTGCDGTHIVRRVIGER